MQSLQGNADARLNFDYQYDELGNIRSIDDLNPTSDTSLAPFSDASYTYDSRNRLTSRTLKGVTKYYAYDRLGNLTGNLLATPTSPANQSYSNAQLPHAIQSAGPTAFAYDADGNMTVRGPQVLGYNAANKLTCSGTSSGCTTVQIGYDANGSRAAELTSAGATFYADDLFEYERTPRIGTAHIFALGREIAFKKIPTVTLRTDAPFGGLPLEQLPRFLVLGLLMASGSVVLVALFRSGAPGAWVRRPAYATGLFTLAVVVALPPQTWAASFPPAPSGVYRRWLSSDRIQSALYVYDEQGRRAHKRVFEPFGGIFEEVNSEGTPRRFATHLFDSSLGLYYMKARFYDPSVGRFTSLDPLIRDSAAIESVNPYSYVENNPVNNVDPDGRALSPADFLNIARGGPTPPLIANGAARSITAVFGPVTVTVSVMINTPPTRLDRIFGQSSAFDLSKARVPVFGGGSIVLDTEDSGPTVPGLVFADGSDLATSDPLGDLEKRTVGELDTRILLEAQQNVDNARDMIRKANTEIKRLETMINRIERSTDFFDVGAASRARKTINGLQNRLDMLRNSLPVLMDGLRRAIRTRDEVSRLLRIPPDPIFRS